MNFPMHESFVYASHEWGGGYCGISELPGGCQWGKGVPNHAKIIKQGPQRVNWRSSKMFLEDQNFVVCHLPYIFLLWSGVWR